MPRHKTVLRVGYTTKKYEISKKDIDEGKFVKLLNRRRIAPNVVKKLHQSLENGKHFDSPFVVNERDGKLRLIDGNHRMDAIEKYLGANPTHRVEVTLNIYEGLDDQEEKDLFTSWNLGRKQNTNDVVKQYEDNIDIFKLMKKDFPVPVSAYGGITAISFFKLVGSYISTKGPKFQGGFIGSPWNFIDKSQELGHSDYNLMKAFMNDFQKAFGPIKNNRFMRTTPFTAIMRIWVDNKQNMLPEKMINYFKLKLVNDKRADDLGSMSGRGACVYVRGQYLVLLNNSRAKDIFVNGDVQSEEEAEQTQMEELGETEGE
jgi:hypothetical protein